MSNDVNDIWIKPSFATSLDNISDKRSKNMKRIPKKRYFNEDSNEDIETKIVNKFKSDSICLLDSMSAQNSSELAFSRYKCNELSDWFRHQFSDKSSESKFLLLNGPTGSGNQFLY